VVIVAADGSTPDLAEGSGFTGFDPFGSGSTFDLAFTGDSSYANAFEVTIGAGYGGGAMAQLGISGFTPGFASGFTEFVFKVKGLVNDNTIQAKLEATGGASVQIDLTSPPANVAVTDLGDGWSQVVIQMVAFGDVSASSQIVFQTLDGAYAEGDTFYLTDIGFSNAGGSTFVNGDFETGDLTGWTQTPDGGTITVETGDLNGRTGATWARLQAAGSAASAQDVLLSQIDLAAGVIDTGDQVTVSYDLTGELFGAGGVVFVELIPFDAVGDQTGNYPIGPFPATPTGTWETYSTTINITQSTAQLAGGVTLQLKASCGPVDGCGVDANFDNVTVTITPAGTGGGTGPTVAAPTPPARDAADVISIFSGAYTDVAGSNYFPDWGQTTVVTTESIAGDDTLKYATFNYEGTVLGSVQDASAMEFLHVDMWTADATVVKVSPIQNTGTAEVLVDLTPIAAGWNSYDIPMSDFTGMTWVDVKEMKFDGQAGVNPSTIYLDNIYFYKGSGGGAGSCDPVGGELATNGGLESGDFSCWTLYNELPTISTDSATGAFAANLVISGALQLSVLKQERIAMGTVSAGQTLNISFKMKGTAADGGVINPKIIFEDDTNGTTAIELGTIANPTLGYTTYPYTVTAGNVGDGISMEFAVACGGASSCNANVLIDDVTITIAP
jgi:hypothetical protein